LQVVAALGGVIGGVVSERLAEYEEDHDLASLGVLFKRVQGFRTRLEAAVSHLKETGDAAYQEYHATRLVNLAVEVINSYLLCILALASERKRAVAELYTAKAAGRIDQALAAIRGNDRSFFSCSGRVLDRDEVVH
jgi:hypothetical protein